jgi:hypothetical protein
VGGSAAPELLAQGCGDAGEGGAELPLQGSAERLEDDPGLAAHTAAFDEWATDALARGDVDALADFRAASGAAIAHPTSEHYVPLLLAVGAAA